MEAQTPQGWRPALQKRRRSGAARGKDGDIKSPVQNKKAPTGVGAQFHTSVMLVQIQEFVKQIIYR